MAAAASSFSQRLSRLRRGGQPLRQPLEGLAHSELERGHVEEDFRHLRLIHERGDAAQIQVVSSNARCRSVLRVSSAAISSPFGAGMPMLARKRIRET